MATAASTPARRTEPVQDKASPYGAWLKISLAGVIVAFLYARILTDLALDWWNIPALSQGMLIPPVAGYIAWLRRDALFAVPPATDRRGLWLTALACVLLLVGKLAAEFFLMRMSFVVLLAAFVWTFWGLGRLRVLGFPFLLLSTMVPLPMIVYNSVSAPLQLFASGISTTLAQWLGITVFQDGNIIHLATTSLGVVEACSGLNSLSALIVASLLLAYLFCSRASSRVLLVFLSVPLAICVNILRITGTALLADYNEELAMGFYHSFSGWLVFVIGFGGLYLLAQIIHRLFERVR